MISELLQEDFIKQCIQVTVCSLLVYDTVLTIDKEIKYFWTKRWYRPTHILFFINRYVGIIGVISKFLNQCFGLTNNLCSSSFRIALTSDIFIEVIIDYILTVRLLALWNKNRLLSIALYSLNVLEAAAKFTLINMLITAAHDQAITLTGGLVVCSMDNDQLERAVYYQLIDWVITTVIGSILLSLALFKTIEHWRSSGLKESSLVNMIIKDQIIYYLMLVFCSGMSIAYSKIGFLVPFSTEPMEQKAIFKLPGNPGFLCLIGSRMFLGLKEVGDSVGREGTSNPSNYNQDDTITDPHFADPTSSSSNSEIQPNSQASYPIMLV